MDRGDGRSIFGAVYIGIALLLLLLAYTNSTSSHGGWAAYQAFWTALITTIFAIFWGIVGVYKLLTSNKGKSTHEIYDYTKQGNEGTHRFLSPQQRGHSNSDIGEYAGGKKRKNSNIEMQIWRNKPLLIIIILLCLFIFSLF